MSDKKITELADGGAVQATDEFVVARGGGNVKIAGSQIGSGGSSSFGSEILQVQATGTMTDCSSSSAGLFFAVSDFTTFFQKGSDITLGDSVVSPGQITFFTAAGGSFGMVTYIGAQLTADAGSSIQRLIQFYSANHGLLDLGTDLLLPLVPSLQIDTMAYAMPYFDIAAGAEFGKNPSFAGAQGVAGDSVHINVIITIWSV